MVSSSNGYTFSNEEQQLLLKIELDTLFVVVFIDFWVMGDILDWDGSRKI